MKTGRTLQELAAELERQTASRRDYIAPQGKIEAVLDTRATTPSVVLDGINGEALPITSFAHRQLASHLGIPQKYYDRMHIDQPDLLAKNITTWLHADPANKRMIRALDGKVRAFLSPKYRPLDNFDLANAVLPVLIDHNVDIVSADLTETRMYIKGILPSLSDELPDGLAYGGHNRIGTDRGHLVAAIVLSNSEVGDGTLRVEPSVFTTWCTNLAIMQQAAMKKYHVGRASSADDESWQVFQDATQKADDAAFWMKVRDVTMAAFNPELFRAAIEDMRAAAGHPITSDNLAGVVDMTIEELALPQKTGGPVLKFLAAGGDLTQWGLASAITRVANDADDYELATMLERAGGTVLAMPQTKWAALNSAAAV